MQVSKLKGCNKRTGLCRLSVKGEMTIYAAEEGLQIFSSYWQQYKQFELDLSEVSEIDTTGIQLLLQFNRKTKAESRPLLIFCCSQAVQDLIDLYRLSERLNLQLTS